LGLDEATGIIDELLAHRKTHILVPTENHWAILRGLITEAQTNAALMMDAHLAALAIEHGATLVTTDRDFSRFLNLKTANPLRG
jgi:predicted nucleic acid-binding protein